MTLKKLSLLTLLLISILPAIASAAAINTDATEAIGTAPDGDAVNGYLIGLLVPDGNYSASEIGDGAVLSEPYVLPVVGNYSMSVVGQVTISSHVATNAALPIEAAPDGDAVSGAWVESVTASGVVSQSVAGGSIVLATNAFEPATIVSAGKVGHVGAVIWDGAVWENVDWNTELRALSTPDDSDVIMINGF